MTKPKELWGVELIEYAGGGTSGFIYETKEEAEDACREYNQEDDELLSADDGWEVRKLLLVKRGGEKDYADYDWDVEPDSMETRQ